MTVGVSDTSADSQETTEKTQENTPVTETNADAGAATTPEMVNEPLLDENADRFVLFPIEYDEIHKYDEREARYHRYQINPKNIELLNNELYLNISNSIIYVYIVPDEIALSLNDEFECKRILKQSYIDKIISGCLDIYGLDFALECIKTTNGWNANYENDREQSTFSKTQISSETIKRIDEVMANYLQK